MNRFIMLIAAQLVLPAVAMAKDSIPDPAKGWDAHLILLTVISTVVYLIVTIPLIYFVIKYRRKKGNEVGAYIEGSVGLEITWTIVPFILIALIGVHSWALFNDYRNVPKDCFEAKVIAQSFSYEMISPEGIRTVNELRAPVGPVKVNLTSKDVIHSFAVPHFRVREDMVPGRETYLWFNAKDPGTYEVFCSQYCGVGHSQMQAKVIILKKEEYDAWVKQNTAEASASLPPEEKGKKLFESLGCIGCHSVTGDKSPGPTFKGVFGSKTALADGTEIVVDETFIKEKVKNPKDKVVKDYQLMMQPNNVMDTDLNAIVAYVKTLK
ncbi:cytochrome c oxidase subunit II [Candidatus Magnetomonas plexicatena]|uniref:cytochrome c oxidase subunit II n=1 Tax=Candidatus Magnetomonas plexicatena TaxID=2552947 RepID=UPI0011016DA3|nr:cytochrome c oxidase subunit II [Nitrospirales bacterium LBB_01]